MRAVKNLPEMQETWIPSLGQDDSLGKEWQPPPVFLLGVFLSSYFNRWLWYSVNCLNYFSQRRFPSFNSKCMFYFGFHCRTQNDNVKVIYVQFISVSQSCLALCDPMNCSTPGLPVLHQLTESTETHVHWVGDAIQPSHLLSSPPPPAPNPSQHQGLSNESACHIRWPKYWSFRFSINPSNEHPGLNSFRMDWLDSLQSKGLSRVFPNTTVQKHRFFRAQLSLESNSHIPTWLLDNHRLE